MPGRVNHAWHIERRPMGPLKDGDLAWRESSVPEPGEGELVVRVVLLSLDPTNRVWLNESDSYLPSVPVGEVVRGFAIGVVEESRSAGFAPGDLVHGLLGWQAFSVIKGAAVRKLPALAVPLEAHFGLLGHIGLAAYFGLIEVAGAKAGETLVVSAAAGAVGSIACQIGKIIGMRVVGVAGTDAKCAWLRDDLGIDAAINYKTANLRDALAEACPAGVDVGFENVGGAVLEAVIDSLNLHGRIALCGMVAQYNASRPVAAPRNLGYLVSKRARMEGFIVLDFLPRAADATRQLVEWYQAGRLKYRVDMVGGLEHAPEALKRLFAGGNTGKLIVRVSAA
jgi:NADPH-dependent curcumin reductase CurA